MMIIDENGFIEYNYPSNFKGVTRSHFLNSKGIIVANPFYVKCLNNKRKKKHGRS